MELPLRAGHSACEPSTQEIVMNHARRARLPAADREPLRAVRGVSPASLKALIESLHERLRVLFATRSQARDAGAVQRQLLLGLELLWKIEEQVLLPVLGGAQTGVAATELRHAIDELELMRDLARLSTQTNPANREAALAALEGLAMLHFARGAELLDAARADAADWPALEHEVRGLLGRWPPEVQLKGGVEYEGRDPVGLPPR
jgi:hypothetical protein